MKKENVSVCKTVTVWGWFRNFYSFTCSRDLRVLVRFLWAPPEKIMHGADKFIGALIVNFLKTDLVTAGCQDGRSPSSVYFDEQKKVC